MRETKKRKKKFYKAMDLDEFLFQLYSIGVGK